VTLAGKCQGAWHCHSLSAWSGHDTEVAVIILVIVFTLATLARIFGR